MNEDNNMTQQNYIDFFLAELEKQENFIGKEYPEYSSDEIKEEAYNYFLTDDSYDELDFDTFVNATVGRLLLESNTPEQAYLDYIFGYNIKDFNKTELTICKKILGLSDNSSGFSSIFYNQICALLEQEKSMKTITETHSTNSKGKGSER